MKKSPFNYFQLYWAFEKKMQNYVEGHCIFGSFYLMGSTATCSVLNSALFHWQQNFLNRNYTGIFFRPCLNTPVINSDPWSLEFYFYDAADFESAEDLLSALSFACGDQERWPFKIIVLLDSLGKFQSGIAAKVHNLFIFVDSCNGGEESLIGKLQYFLNGFFDPISQRGLICVDLADIHVVIQGTGQHYYETFTFDLAQIESLWERVRTKLRNHLGIASLYLYFSVGMDATLSLLVEADKFLDSIFPEAFTTIAIQINPDVVNKEGCKLVIYLSQHKVKVCDDDEISRFVSKLLSEATFNADGVMEVR